MKTITLSKVPPDHLQILQSELLVYAEGFRDHLKNTEEHGVFLYSIGQVDTAKTLFKNLRPKVEKNKKVTLTLKLTEAAVLLNACGNATVLSTHEYVVHVTEIYKELINHELKSMSLTIYLLDQ